MKTAMQELMAFEKNIRDRFGWKLTAFQVLKLVQKKMNRLLEKEKQQIIDSFNQGYREGETETMTASKEDVANFDDAKNYYNETFKN